MSTFCCSRCKLLPNGKKQDLTLHPSEGGHLVTPLIFLLFGQLGDNMC